jgi:hypothetical protein
MSTPFRLHVQNAFDVKHKNFVMFLISMLLSKCLISNLEIAFAYGFTHHNVP